MKTGRAAVACSRMPGSGEVWAVTGTDTAALSEWCERFADDAETEGRTSLLSFAQQSEASGKTGWLQARYYEDNGATVSDFLSYNSVWEVNPFEVGARRPETRKEYGARLDRLMRLLELRALADKPVIALSNGETRRLLFARALAKGPSLLVLDDPAAGLDVRQIGKLKDVLTALARRGMSIVIAYRHADEVPDGVKSWFRLCPRGIRAVSKPKDAMCATGACAVEPSHRTAKRRAASPVVEINHLDISFGDRMLFHDFSWTVRKGERWVLRGPNGSGKTTLMALIIGDSPLAYAADIKVFGQPRSVGTQLSRIRRRIGIVSPEMQAYLGLGPERLLSDALGGRHDLLILDEPFLNLAPRAARAAARRINEWLKDNPAATAILICHRADETPKGFDLELDLGVRS